MVTVNIIDSTQPGKLERWGVAYNYLELRLRVELGKIQPNAFQIAPIAKRRATTDDVTAAVQSKSILVVIVERGQQALAESLARAAGSRSNVHGDMNEVCDGKGTARGITFGPLSIVGTAEMKDWDFGDDAVGRMHQSQENSYFLSNVLVHEVGHALHSLSSSATPHGFADRDHRTLGVMAGKSPNDGHQRSYTEEFRRQIRHILPARH